MENRSLLLPPIDQPLAVSRIKRGSFLYKLFHLQLIDHVPEAKDREWWARCRLEHICITPYLTYDLLRIAILAAIFATFMPLPFMLAMMVSGGCIAMCQVHVDRRYRNQTHSNRENLALVRRVVLARTLHLAVLNAIALFNAPADLLIVLVPIAVMLMWIEAVALLAIPRAAVLSAAINGLAILIPMSLAGTATAAGAAMVAVASFFTIHWAVFHLHYMFATRRLRTRKLTEANDTIQLLLNQYDQDGSDWLFECSEKGRILRPSPRFCEAAGQTAETLEGMQLLDLFYDSPERDELRLMGGQDQSFQRLVVPVIIDRKKRWWSISARKVTSSDGERRYWRGFVADVTRARAAEEKVTYMAHYDVLTDLPNRALFNSSVSRAFARRKDNGLVAILAIDLDHFKQINDSFGHAGGDRALRQAGERIEALARPGMLVARIGGDEFAVLIEGPASREQVIAFADTVVEAMNDPVEIEGQKAQLGACVGVAFAPADGTSGDEVMQAADLALYQAKANGRRAAVLFDKSMQERFQERRKLEVDLRSALVRGELQLHYQPLVDTQTTQVVGYEALLRWNHPVRGSVSPDEFVPIAEETGQIVSIGAWVLREALAEASRWPDHLTVSVNLSPVQTRGGADLYTTIVQALAASNVSAHRLELEITETVLMQENQETIALLHKIRALGVQIALDDFGIGYSSLNYLRAFPFDKIKIDRRFVGDMAVREDSDAIVRAVIALATQLNMRTTAEGVENTEQLERIRETQCTQLQGYLFSRAVPAEQLTHRQATFERMQTSPIAHLSANRVRGNSGAEQRHSA